MKALPRPSLTLLWVARLYAVWELVSRLVRLIFYSSGPNTTICTYSSNSKVATYVVYSGPTASFVAEIVFFACLAFGLFLLHRPLGRIMVGSAAVGLLFMSSFWVLRVVYSLSMANSISSDFLYHKFLLLLAGSYCGAVLQVGYLWLALLPPEKTNKIETDHFPPFASPQIS